MRGRKNPPLDLTPVPEGTPLTFDTMAQTYLQDYALQRYRTMSTARARVEHLRSFFAGWSVEAMTADAARRYQLYRREQGAEAATINRETSALSRMFQLAIRRGLIERMPLFPKRLEENPPREGFFEHNEFLQVRAELPPAFQDVLDFAYYSGWRRNEILYLTWDDVDFRGGVVRLTPRRSKTRTGRVLPISSPLRQVLERREQLRLKGDPRVFHRDGVPVRTWRYALRDACQRAHVPHRLLHDCRRTAARNLVRAGVPERVAMLLTGHKTRAVFDRYNIVNERELLSAGQTLAAYVQQVQDGTRRVTRKRGRPPTAKESTTPTSEQVRES